MECDLHTATPAPIIAISVISVRLSGEEFCISWDVKRKSNMPS